MTQIKILPRKNYSVRIVHNTSDITLKELTYNLTSTDSVVLTPETNTAYKKVTIVPQAETAIVSYNGEGSYIVRPSSGKILEEVDVNVYDVINNEILAAADRAHNFEDQKTYTVFDTAKIVFAVDPSINSNMSGAFLNNPYIVYFGGAISSPITNMVDAFFGCDALKYVGDLDCSQLYGDTIEEAFEGCSSLTHIGRLKNLGQSFNDSDALDLSSCPLDEMCLINIANSVYDFRVSGLEGILRVSHDTYDKLTGTQMVFEGATMSILDVLSTKGWTVNA